MTGPTVLDGRTPEAVDRAVEILTAGGVVAIPTETVYGLAAATHDPAAIAEVYRLKGRPTDNPLIAHVLDVEAAQALVRPGSLSDAVRRLADAFWPGPLTFVLPKSDEVDSIATGGRDSIAVRAPGHPVARAVLEAFGAPLSAPSANRSGAVSPTLATHVATDHADHALCILDGGPAEVGLESTVLDLRGSTPCILRPGHVTAEDLLPVIGRVEVSTAAMQGDSPGTAPRHYAPQTPVELVERFDVSGEDDAVIRFRQPAPDRSRLDCPLGDDAGAAGQALFDAMRRCDRSGASRILIERPPAGPEWEAIADRLRRASIEA